jgi:hypothetical protein
MSTKMDGSFNRIDSELRQIEDYINHIERDSEALEAKLLKIQRPRLVRNDIGVLMRDYAAGLRADARLNRQHNPDFLRATASWLERKTDEIDALVDERNRLKAFWDRLCEQMFDGWTFEYDHFITIGEETGLLVKEIFDPEGRHKDMNVGECEPGEDCWFNIYALEEAKKDDEKDS